MRRAFKRIVCCLLLVSIFAQTHSLQAEETPAAKLPPKEKFHLFLLVGQSNMAGRGAVSQEDRTPHPRVLMLNQARQWVPAVDPLHFDKPVAGTGLGKTFGIAIAENDPEITVGLIPCAVGGTAISRWEPGAEDKATQTHPWDDCMVRANAALEAGTLKGILWHQGEGDCNPELAAVYARNLESLINRFRTELHAPDVPFVLGQLGQFPEKPWGASAKSIDASLHQIAIQLPHVALVSSEGLTDKGDHIHFNAESCREFGKRYANAFLKLSKEN